MSPLRRLGQVPRDAPHQGLESLLALNSPGFRLGPAVKVLPKLRPDSIEEVVIEQVVAEPLAERLPQRTESTAAGHALESSASWRP